MFYKQSQMFSGALTQPIFPFMFMAPLLLLPHLWAQVQNPTAPTTPQASAASKPGSAEQVAHLFGLDGMLQKLNDLRSDREATFPRTSEQAALSQQLLITVQIDLLDIDSVLSEISNERNELGDLRTSLQMRRDKTVGRLTTAALLTGSGLGIATSATQFTTLGSTTQNVGDSIGVGSGVASTLLSILAAHKQSGPSEPVLETPNMLAPLLGGKPVLSTSYPSSVLGYLQTVPAGEDPARGTRLDQLKERWIKSGRLSQPGSSKEKNKLVAATVSGQPDTKVSIDDLNNRIAMLGDVEGTVSLIKRDLSTLLRQYTLQPERAK